ncbi:MAG: hypothetical protein NTX54_05490 [Chloroflexi bacterium]|nr:hypothetical protein [Chloroflexota bacterium]
MAPDASPVHPEAPHPVPVAVLVALGRITPPVVTVPLLMTDQSPSLTRMVTTRIVKAIRDLPGFEDALVTVEPGIFNMYDIEVFTTGLRVDLWPSDAPAAGWFRNSSLRLPCPDEDWDEVARVANAAMRPVAWFATVPLMEGEPDFAYPVIPIRATDTAPDIGRFGAARVHPIPLVIIRIPQGRMSDDAWRALANRVQRQAGKRFIRNGAYAQAIIIVKQMESVDAETLERLGIGPQPLATVHRLLNPNEDDPQTSPEISPSYFRASVTFELENALLTRVVRKLVVKAIANPLIRAGLRLRGELGWLAVRVEAPEPVRVVPAPASANPANPAGATAAWLLDYDQVFPGVAGGLARKPTATPPSQAFKRRTVARLRTDPTLPPFGPPIVTISIHPHDDRLASRVGRSCTRRLARIRGYDGVTVRVLPLPFHPAPGFPSDQAAFRVDDITLVMADGTPFVAPVKPDGKCRVINRRAEIARIGGTIGQALDRALVRRSLVTHVPWA